MTELREALIAWFAAEKRDLPWRRTRDPYAIWLSETMAQQTRIAALLPRYEAFLLRFPSVAALAEAREEDVLKLWEGLGYYNRARKLHEAARRIVGECGGALPPSARELQTLPGVGPYTAAAVASIAFGERIPAVDGNALRVVSRLFCLRGDIATPKAKDAVAKAMHALLPPEKPGAGNEAVMELGALICLPKKPRCGLCPVEAHCAARANGCEGELPVKSAKAAPKTIRRAVALVRNEDGAWLLRKRSEALLRGLYEFPGVESPFVADDLALLTAMLAAHGVSAAPCDAAAIPVTHVFTHRRWDMHGYFFASPGREAPEGHFWVQAERFSAHAFPSAMREFVAAALERVGCGCYNEVE